MPGWGTCHFRHRFGGSSGLSERLSGGQYLLEGRLKLGALDALFVDQQSGEEGVVEGGSCFVLGPQVELADVIDERQAGFECLGARGEGGFGLVSLILDPGSVDSNLVEALPDLGLRQALHGQVDEAFLAGVEVGQFLLQGGFHVTQAALLFGDGRPDKARQSFGEAVWQRDGGVVLNDVMLDQFARQIWQITLAALAPHAHEVVVDAALARGLGVDEFVPAALPLAAVAVELLLEIVEVRSVPPGRG